MVTEPGNSATWQVPDVGIIQARNPWVPPIQHPTVPQTGTSLMNQYPMFPQQARNQYHMFPQQTMNQYPIVPTTSDEPVFHIPTTSDEPNNVVDTNVLWHSTNITFRISGTGI